MAMLSSCRVVLLTLKLVARCGATPNCAPPLSPAPDSPATTKPVEKISWTQRRLAGTLKPGDKPQIYSDSQSRNHHPLQGLRAFLGTLLDASNICMFLKQAPTGSLLQCIQTTAVHIHLRPCSVEGL
ncbi:hypothetical protein PBY51_013935 [Eleginops maclovinus]|uniref:Uncharacterized protein n=1 Tax=Eleginops maclovinus TaxID=56733 RepID=A0AAN8AB90_ELEMC|nr:hypothetical protein PBY51_013935 [Eleginops maclovinus]